ncbi:unnamed protein product, partial [Onchocerca flexuosa]|uniref:PiggyBac transposable element-derived protein 3 n=1 Tax=Onchocerca flexuosa TaxID=387005 RepID=A0A183HBR8_9BILA
IRVKCSAATKKTEYTRVWYGKYDVSSITKNVCGFFNGLMKYAKLEPCGLLDILPESRRLQEEKIAVNSGLKRMTRESKWKNNVAIFIDDKYMHQLTNSKYCILSLFNL